MAALLFETMIGLRQFVDVGGVKYGINQEVDQHPQPQPGIFKWRIKVVE